tara:strand:- start:3278 stop:4198 length:921 start_codon:yes stop_codon:yes gene_type:complete
MAFLDNSGDIILDAVLTDTGRMRLAKGDGSFNITKFGLGDDEINYGLYDKNHPSGSAYFDIEILQTPVLEAFTNNASTMKSKLLSISRTNLLYLPEVRNNSTDGIAANSSNNVVSVAVDDSTVTALLDSNSNLLAGIINGVELAKNATDNRRLLFDQGMVSDALGKTGDVSLDADLVETQYIVEVDNRLGRLYDPSGLQATPSFIDDDNIASYYLSLTTNTTYFSNSTLDESSVLSGPAGYRLSLLVGASTNVNSSTYLFTQLGSTSTIDPGSGAVSLYHIDTTIRISGATTGFKVEIPIRLLKKQ